MIPTREALREDTIRLIHDVIKNDDDPSGLDDATIHRITMGLTDPIARDRAMAFIYPCELNNARILWHHAIARCETTGYTGYTPALHTLAAWGHFVAGERHGAAIAVHAALAIDASYVMARLLHSFLDDGLDPDHLMFLVLEERDKHPEGQS
ncbi:hypothetical protein GCM10020367_20500 [Streptomyces sannanensis]|uniref:DUF4192 family protein n=1 Tax=Streptomyces sannanensis TaxID=285536 RepID=A0ABP6S9G6_9ACTN